MTAEEYLRQVRNRLSRTVGVQSVTVVQETIKEEVGLYRYRLAFRNGDLLEAFERFQVRSGQIEVLKYSFHWQDKDGNLLARWDTAPHHPGIPTFPHPIHDGGETNIQPHAQVSIGDVLAEIGRRLQDT